MEQDEVDELKEWRATTIDKDLHVDCLLANRWLYGMIKSINFENINGVDYKILNIQPKMDGMYPDNQTRPFALALVTMQQITLPLTRSMQQLPHMLKWRKDLKIGDQCAVFHQSANTWHDGTIVGVDDGANKLIVKYYGSFEMEIYRDYIGLQLHTPNSSQKYGFEQAKYTS